MLLALSAVERQAILAKFVLAYGNDVEELSETVEVENGAGPVTFTVNDPVRFERPDSWAMLQPHLYRGIVTVFVKLTDPNLGRQRFGIVLVEGKHGECQQYRVLLSDLQHDTYENS